MLSSTNRDGPDPVGILTMTSTLHLKARRRCTRPRADTTSVRPLFQIDQVDQVDDGREHRRLNARTLREQTQELIAREIGFIDSDEFESPAEILDAVPSVRDICIVSQQPAPPNSVDHESMLAGIKQQLEVPLLKPGEEQLLFRQMNYCRFRANCLRSRLNPSRPSRRKLNDILAQLADADAARERIIASNTRLVVSLAQKHSGSRQQFEEFISEGLMILLNAIDKFDYSRGFRFSTYATHSLTRHFYRCWQQTRKQYERFVPTSSDILGEMISVESTEPETNEDTELMNFVVKHSSQCLDARERRIIDLRFGLSGKAARTLRDVAVILNLSKERVRQIQVRAIEKLRGLADEWKPQSQNGTAAEAV